MSQIYVATKTFSAVVNGERVQVMAGTTRADGDHEIVKTYPDRFTPLDVQFGMEDARSAPAPAKKTARKRAAKDKDQG